MARLGSRADIVMSQAVVEAMVSAAEDGVPAIFITGTREEDANGAYYDLTEPSEKPVGMSVTSREGGTEPDGDVMAMFSESFKDGVLAVVDQYAGEFALYVIEDGVPRKASAVLSE